VASKGFSPSNGKQGFGELVCAYGGLCSGGEKLKLLGGSRVERSSTVRWRRDLRR